MQLNNSEDQGCSFWDIFQGEERNVIEEKAKGCEEKDAEKRAFCDILQLPDSTMTLHWDTATVYASVHMCLALLCFATFGLKYT